MSTALVKEDILGYEFKHATYSRSPDKQDDILVVKENIVKKDGSRIPNVRIIKNYKRDFWITKEGYRNHKDKKEWEKESRLMKFTSTQTKLAENVARALGKPTFNAQMRMLSSSLWLYGTDIPISSLLKKQYQDKWPNCLGTTSTVAVLDIETDVVHGTEEILSISLTYGNKCILTATKFFLGSIVNPVDKVHKAFEHYLPEHKAKREIDLEFAICDDPYDCCKRIFEKAHEWKPDFIAIWNMAYDLPRIEKAIINAGYNPEALISDPKVPKEYQQYKFIEGPSHMVTASGKPKKLMPAERWHNVIATSSFYFIDAMCLYKRIRIADGNESSYSLDNILDQKLGIRKLKFDEVKETGLKWHIRMQTEFKIEYLIYNLFDCISMELLDEMIGDVRRAFPALCGVSDFSRFKSNPKRIVDDLHFYCRENGLVIGTFADNVADDLDQYVIPPDGLIVTLPSENVDEGGLRIISDLPDVGTLVRAHVADLDIEGTYPWSQAVSNGSKETTYRELASIRGLNHEQRKAIGINLTAGTVNALEICTTALQLPTTDTLLQGFLQKRNAA